MRSIMSTILSDQLRIIECARSYVGTPFHHQGRLGCSAGHRGGVDCLGLLICVARECGLRSKNGQLLADCDEFNYPHYPDTQRLRTMLATYLHELPPSDYQSANIALFEIEGRAQHMGIIATQIDANNAAKTTIIHAYAPARKVVEHPLDDYWQRRMVGLFGIF